MLMVPTARALTIQVYTERTAWVTAVGSFAADGFESAPLGIVERTPSYEPDVELDDLAIKLIGAGEMEFHDSGLVDGTREFQGRISHQSSSVGFSLGWRTTLLPFPPFVVTTRDPLVAFGGDWADSLQEGRLQLTVLGTTIAFDQYLSGKGDGFLGIVSDTPFEVAVVSSTGIGPEGHAFQLDSVVLVVPEPSVSLLFAAGVAFLGQWRRRPGRCWDRE
jgi:hypothetical protein